MLLTSMIMMPLSKKIQLSVKKESSHSLKNFYKYFKLYKKAKKALQHQKTTKTITEEKIARARFLNAAMQLRDDPNVVVESKEACAKMIVLLFALQKVDKKESFLSTAE